MLRQASRGLQASRRSTRSTSSEAMRTGLGGVRSWNRPPRDWHRLCSSLSPRTTRSFMRLPCRARAALRMREGLRLRHRRSAASVQSCNNCMDPSGSAAAVLRYLAGLDAATDRDAEAGRQAPRTSWPTDCDDRQSITAKHLAVARAYAACRAAALPPRPVQGSCTSRCRAGRRITATPQTTQGRPLSRRQGARGRGTQGKGGRRVRRCAGAGHSRGAQRHITAQPRHSTRSLTSCWTASGPPHPRNAGVREADRRVVAPSRPRHGAGGTHSPSASEMHRRPAAAQAQRGSRRNCRTRSDCASCRTRRRSSLPPEARFGRSGHRRATIAAISHLGPRVRTDANGFCVGRPAARGSRAASALDPAGRRQPRSSPRLVMLGRRTVRCSSVADGCRSCAGVRDPPPAMFCGAACRASRAPWRRWSPM